MVYIAYFTELNLQICDYAQKRHICRENCKYAFDENFHGHFCLWRKAAKFCHPALCILYLLLCTITKGIEQSFLCGCEGSASPAFHCFQDWSFERIFGQTREKSWSQNVHPSRERNTMETMTDLDSDLEYLIFFYVSASLSSRVSYSGITRNFFNSTSVVFEHL